MPVVKRTKIIEWYCSCEVLETVNKQYDDIAKLKLMKVFNKFQWIKRWVKDTGADGWHMRELFNSLPKNSFNWNPHCKTIKSRWDLKRNEL